LGSLASPPPAPPWPGALGRQLVEPLREIRERVDRLRSLRPLGRQVGDVLSFTGVSSVGGRQLREQRRDVSF
jgi:hypothetical protein